MKTIKEPAVETPVIFETDVVVVGGGPGGIGAALAAARNGAGTILVERCNCCGGLATQGLVTAFEGVDFHVNSGIFEEVVRGLKKRGAVDLETYGQYYFDIEHYKRLLDEIMKQSGVKLLYHARGVGAVKEGNTIKGIIIDSEEGREAILAKMVIDCTRFGTIAIRSGAQIRRLSNVFYATMVMFRGLDFAELLKLQISDPDFKINPLSESKLPPTRGGLPANPWVFSGGAEGIRKARERGEITYNDDLFINMFPLAGAGRGLMLHFMEPDTRNWELETRTKAELKMRDRQWALYEHLKKNVRGFQDSALEHTPNELGVFSTKVIGDYIVTGEDVYEGRAFDDAIQVADWITDSVVGRRFDVPLHDIPYRSIYSKNIDNLLVGGVLTSTDDIGFFTTMNMPTCMSVGQAAGTAAALAVKTGMSARKLDVKLLQKTLREQGQNISRKYLPKEVIEEYDGWARKVREQSREKGTNLAQEERDI